MTAATHTKVLIVGAGPTGLALAIELGSRGDRGNCTVRCRLDAQAGRTCKPVVVDVDCSEEMAFSINRRARRLMMPT